MIGKAVVDTLVRKNFNIIATDNMPNPFDAAENLTYIQCKITDEVIISSIFRKNHIHALVNLACSADNDFDNIMTPDDEKISELVDRYIYRLAQRSGTDILMMLSTHQVYAVEKTREPVREAMDTRPSTVYGKMKLNSEEALGAALKNSSGTRGICIRVCPIYTKTYIDNLKPKVYDAKANCGFVYGEGEYGYTFTCLYNIPDFIYGVLTCSDDIACDGIYNVCDTSPVRAKDIVSRLMDMHQLGVVISRNYRPDAIMTAVAVFKSKAAKTDYRYNDLSVACSNIRYDSTKAQRIAPIRWNFENTK